ncbi:MAG: ABC transporter ATP-binding protein, partial [Alphaproteobacteria bacterium]|nr:ABC transporter ATP-binding protein [Alphaproteobacteria bacterium]
MAKKEFNHVTQLPKTLWGFYRQYSIQNYKLLLVCWMVMVLFAYAGGIIWPNFQRWVVSMFETMPADVSVVKYAMPTIILITLLNMFMTGTGLLRETVSSHLWPQFRNQSSEILMNYTHRQSMSFWTNKMAGSINTQIGYINSGFTEGVAELWNCVGRLMVIFVNGFLLLSINTWVCYLFVFALFFRIMYAYNMRKRVKKASEEASAANSTLTGKLIDSFSNYSIVKLFAGSDKEQKILKEPRKKSVDAQVYSRYTMRLFWAVPGFLWDVLFGLTILLCCVLYQQGQMLVSEIVFTISVYIEVMGAVGMLINRFPDIIDKTAAAKKAYKELVVPLDIVDKENAKPLRVKQGQIELRNIYFKYK